ncbi:MAG: hypothetical protein PWQ70_2198 [Clostridiales bacterium]|nr:hypothetical protein [Clostridiales bacterium]
MSFSKFVRTLNKVDRVRKDTKAVGNALFGDGKYAKTRVKNKIKGGLFKKLWKMF